MILLLMHGSGLYRNKFQTVEWTKLEFPATFLIDYVRVYQRSGSENIGCSPNGTSSFLSTERCLTLAD